jgi:hypothetical protein
VGPSPMSLDDVEEAHQGILVEGWAGGAVDTRQDTFHGPLNRCASA